MSARTIVQTAKFSTKLSSAQANTSLLTDFVSSKGALELHARRGSGVVATVFGSTGFLGRYAVYRLARLGVQVVIPFRGEEKACGHLKVTGEVGQIVPVRFDIRDKESVKRAVSRSSIVVNLLGKHHDTRHFTMEQANTNSADVIAEESKKAGVERFVHVSSVALTGNPSRLAKSKLAGEEAVKSHIPSATILRLATVFGPEDRLLNKWGWLTKRAAIVPIPYSKHAKIQPLYVRDFAAALEATLGERDSVGKTYELGGPNVYTMEDFINNCIFEYTRNDYSRLVELPYPLSIMLAYLSEHTRRALFSRDELVFYSVDNTVNARDPTILTLPSLHVSPSSVEEFGVNILRQYRKSVNFNTA